MRFYPLKISGVFLIEPELHQDERGIFRRHFCAEEFAKHGLETRVVQANISENLHLHTLRGFHYQEAPHGEAKTISCIAGAVHVVVIDLRPESKTYLEWLPQRLRAADRRSLHVPVGCALAFLTLAYNTILQYYVSAAYAPGAYRGLRWNDPAFKIEWPTEPKVISEQDRSWPNYERR